MLRKRLIEFFFSVKDKVQFVKRISMPSSQIWTTTCCRRKKNAVNLSNNHDKCLLPFSLPKVDTHCQVWKTGGADLPLGS
jgi:hypothetical protein